MAKSASYMARNRAGGSAGTNNIAQSETGTMAASARATQEREETRAAARTRQEETQVDIGITAKEQENYKKQISKLTDAQINKMTRRQLESWLEKSELAKIGEKFYAKTVEEARYRVYALSPSNSLAQLKKSLKYSRSKFRKETK